MQTSDFVSKPLEILMKEHRLIERMLPFIESVARDIQSTNEVDPTIIDVIVDFFQTYTDRHHHGKEEDILFAKLDKKTLEIKHLKAMEDLVNEHNIAREKVGKLVNEKAKYMTGDLEALQKIVVILQELAEFYPQHIQKEDKHFFPSADTYLNEEEILEITKMFERHDESPIHEQYVQIVDELVNN